MIRRMRIVPGQTPDRPGPASPPSLEAAATDDTPKVLRPRWRSLLLVCGKCEDRSKGPKSGTTKKLVKAIGAACRTAGLPRPRRLVTGCMGACPKKACTIAGIDEQGRTTLLAMKRGDDAVAAVRLLYGAVAPEPAVAAPALRPLVADGASAPSNSTSSAPSAT